LHQRHCAERACFNPEHLYLGTHADNMRDMAVMGGSRGERNGRAKLTEDAVLAIRLARKSQSQLAKEFGVSQQIVSRIRLGQALGYL
jgi:hypothetical protein